MQINSEYEYEQFEIELDFVRDDIKRWSSKPSKTLETLKGLERDMSCAIAVWEGKTK